MSGLEPLAALGLACSITQLISFSHEAISVCKQIHRSGSADPSLLENTTHLKELSTSLSGQLNRGPLPLPRDDSKLLEVARSCLSATDDLRKELQDLAVPANLRGLPATIKVGGKGLWRKRRIERLEKTLETSQRTMETYLLARIWTRIDATALLHEQNFQNMSKDLRIFVGKLSEGNRQLPQLVQRNMANMKDHVTTESTRTRQELNLDLTTGLTHTREALQQSITQESSKTTESVNAFVAQEAAKTTKGLEDHVTITASQSATQSRRDRLLASLKYEGMNARYNQIVPEHERTFRWIFKKQGKGMERGSDQWTSSSDDDDTNSTNDEDSSGSNGEPSEPQLQRQNCDLKRVEVDTQHSNDGRQSELDSDSSEADIELEDEDDGHLDSDIKLESDSDSDSDSDTDISRSNVHWDNFLHWLESGEHVYWIGGKPGSGKSTLMKYIVCDDITRAGDSSQPTCIFIDGLDEISSKDGSASLLRFLDELLAIHSVKFCVSSRPEAAFKRRLEACPMLRIQDLTSSDIRRYVKDTLNLPSGATLRNEHWSEIIDLSVKKAEGVFLWAHVTLKSLQRGIENDDDVQDLYERLYALPNDLVALYKDMWNRQGEDYKLYSESAALYLKLVLAAQNTQVTTFSVFELMAAAEPHVLEAFLYGNPVEPAPLHELYIKTFNRIEVYCAGLLETRGSYKAQLCDLHEEPYKAFAPDVNVVGFIHRTAQDFLTDTADGQQLLNRSSMNRGVAIQRLFKARLVRLNIWALKGPRRSRVPHTYDLAFFLNDFSMVYQQMSQDASREIFSLFREAYEDGKLSYTMTNTKQPHFMHVLATRGHLEPFLIDSYSQGQQAISTDETFFSYTLQILAKYEYFTASSYRFIVQTINLVEHGSGVVHQLPDPFSELSPLESALRLETPLSNALDTTLQVICFPSNDSFNPGMDSIELALQAVLAVLVLIGPMQRHLDDRVIIEVNLDDVLGHLGNCSSLCYTMREPLILLEVNLSFLTRMTITWILRENVGLMSVVDLISQAIGQCLPDASVLLASHEDDICKVTAPDSDYLLEALMPALMAEIPRAIESEYLADAKERFDEVLSRSTRISRAESREYARQKGLVVTSQDVIHESGSPLGKHMCTCEFPTLKRQLDDAKRERALERSSGRRASIAQQL
ncbi:hypothetical protein BJ170DRAFT_733728 [Xylariales sp. AK1849]|nr:hypothetical protein BJ170DRAFT_733728 [Xylariales sp. AK1849]